MSLSLFFQLKDKAGPSLTTTVAMPVFSTKNETVRKKKKKKLSKEFLLFLSKSVCVCVCECLHAEEPGHSAGGGGNRHPSA